MQNTNTERKKHTPEFKDYVYVIEFGEKLVKVGRSMDPDTRAKNVASASGRTQVRMWVSPAVLNAGPWESRVHSSLAESRQVGEWFGCSFDEAVSVAKHLQLVEELWTAEGQARISAASEKNFEMLKGLLMASASDQMGRIHADVKIQFLEDMRERSIKNCEAYLHYRSAAETCFWSAVERELTNTNINDLDREIAITLAYANEEYIAATRIEHVHLGITMESCMIVLGDVEKIPAMLEEIEAIAYQRAEQKGDML